MCLLGTYEYVEPCASFSFTIRPINRHLFSAPDQKKIMGGGKHLSIASVGQTGTAHTEAKIIILFGYLIYAYFLSRIIQLRTFSCRIDVMLHCHPVVGSLAVMMSGLCAGNDLGTGYVGTSTLNSQRTIGSPLF